MVMRFLRHHGGALAAAAASLSGAWNFQNKPYFKTYNPYFYSTPVACAPKPIVPIGVAHGSLTPFRDHYQRFDRDRDVLSRYLGLIDEVVERLVEGTAAVLLDADAATDDDLGR